MLLVVMPWLLIAMPFAILPAPWIPLKTNSPKIGQGSQASLGVSPNTSGPKRREVDFQCFFGGSTGLPTAFLRTMARPFQRFPNFSVPWSL